MKCRIIVLVSGLILAFLSTGAMAEAPALPGDLGKMQLNTEATTKDWPLYGGNYKAWRYSALTQINKQNVQGLKPAWQLETGLQDAFEASPIVINGVMYVTTPWNQVMALDGKTGKEYWRYVHPLEKSLASLLRSGEPGRGSRAWQSLYRNS